MCDVVFIVVSVSVLSLFCVLLLLCVLLLRVLLLICISFCFLSEDCEKRSAFLPEFLDSKQVDLRVREAQDRCGDQGNEDGQYCDAGEGFCAKVKVFCAAVEVFCAAVEAFRLK